MAFFNKGEKKIIIQINIKSFAWSNNLFILIQYKIHKKKSPCCKITNKKLAKFANELSSATATHLKFYIEFNKVRTHARIQPNNKII